MDGALRVGGPATSKAEWIADFIAHCHSQKVPVDFISTHLYAQDEQVQYPDRVGSPHAVGEFFAESVRAVYSAVAASPLPHLEIHWTEWNSQTAATAAQITWGENIHVDNAYAGTFIARNCAEIDRSCHSFGWWVASDIFEEGGFPSAPLSCTYGLLTIHGFPKASANAFRLLRRMEGDRLDCHFPDSRHTGTGGVATQADLHTHVLLWNHAHAELPSTPAWKDTLDFSWPHAHPPQVIAARVGPKGGSVYEAWVSLGCPANLTRAQFAFLRNRSEPDWSLLPVEVQEGRGRVELSIQPHELLYLDISPASLAVGVDPRLLSNEWVEWDKKMGETSR